MNPDLKKLYDKEVSLRRQILDMYILATAKNFQALQKLLDAELLTIEQIKNLSLCPWSTTIRVKRTDLPQYRRALECPLKLVWKDIPYDSTDRISSTLIPRDYPELRLKWEEPYLPNGKCKIVKKDMEFYTLVCEK